MRDVILWTSEQPLVLHTMTFPSLFSGLFRFSAIFVPALLTFSGFPHVFTSAESSFVKASCGELPRSSCLSRLTRKGNSHDAH